MTKEEYNTVLNNYIKLANNIEIISSNPAPRGIYALKAAILNGTLDEELAKPPDLPNIVSMKIDGFGGLTLFDFVVKLGYSLEEFKLAAAKYI